MINYSITMRSVNTNLLEINQAKSRINLVKTEKKNAFAVSQYSDVTSCVG